MSFELPDDIYIPAPLTAPGVHRVALLSGLQGLLVRNAPVTLAHLAAALAHGLRDLRVGPAATTDPPRWEPALRYMVVSCEFAIELLAQRGGESTRRLATPDGSARFVVDWLNAPMRAHRESLATLRSRAEQRARRQRACVAAAHARLADGIVGVAALTADLGRWYEGGGRRPVISATGQIASWSAAVIHAGRVHAATCEVAELLDAEVASHGDL